MTNSEPRATRMFLNLTPKEMALKLNTPERTYQGWEQGRKMPGVVYAALKLIIELNKD